MCIGVPMQVLEVDEALRARCSDGQDEHWVDIRLIDPPAAGDWLLVFLGAAREQISAERAAQVSQALAALEAVNRGDIAQLDSLFADLTEREPQLPPHLQAQWAATRKPNP